MSDAGHCGGDQTGEHRDKPGAAKTGDNPAEDVAEAMRNCLRDGKDNADDQAGFDNFAEDYDERTDQSAPFVMPCGAWR